MEKKKKQYFRAGGHQKQVNIFAESSSRGLLHYFQPALNEHLFRYISGCQQWVAAVGSTEHMLRMSFCDRPSSVVRRLLSVIGPHFQIMTSPLKPLAQFQPSLYEKRQWKGGGKNCSMFQARVIFLAVGPVLLINDYIFLLTTSSPKPHEIFQQNFTVRGQSVFDKVVLKLLVWVTFQRFKRNIYFF